MNYLWHTDDLLGQGATASVYKARNKVGHSPGCRAPCAQEVTSPVSPSRHPGLCVAGQRPLDLAFYTLEPGGTGGLSSGVGGCKGLLRMMPLLGTGWDWRERDEDTRWSLGGDSKSRSSRGGRWGLFGIFLLSSQSCVAYTGRDVLCSLV